VNRWVFWARRNECTVDAAVTVDSRLFHALAAATGNASLPSDDLLRRALVNSMISDAVWTPLNFERLLSCLHAVFCQFRQRRSVRRSLTIDARHTLVSAFIASRVDYCNAVLYGVCKSHLTATDGAQRRHSSRRRHWQVWPHHAGSSRRSPLAASTSEDWQVSLFSRSTVPVVLALPTSKMFACRCWILLLGALSVRLSVVTCLFLEERRSSVDGVSRWLLRSSGIHYRLTITTD